MEPGRMKKLRESFMNDVSDVVKNLRLLDERFQLDYFDFIENVNRFPKESKISVVIEGFMNAGKSCLSNRLLYKNSKSDQYRRNFCPVERETFTPMAWELSHTEDWKKLCLENGIDFDEKDVDKDSYVLEKRVFENSEDKFERIVLGENADEELYMFVHTLRTLSPSEEGKDVMEKMESFMKNYKPVVRVYINAKVLRRIRIIDCPGKGETKELSKILMNVAKRCHLMIYVFKVHEGKINQNDTGFLRLLKIECSKEGKIPLSRRILFVGNHSDSLIPSSKFVRVKFVEEDSEGNIINTKPLFHEKQENTRRLILEKLNHESMFGGVISLNQIYLTCLDDTRNPAKHLFEGDFNRLFEDLFRRRDEYLFKYPAEETFNPILNTISSKIDELEKTKNRIRDLETTKDKLVKKRPEVLKHIMIVQEKMINELIKGLDDIFSNVESIQEAVCHEEFQENLLHGYWLKIRKEKVAFGHLSNKLQVIMNNRIQDIYRKKYDKFHTLMLKSVRSLFNQVIEAERGNYIHTSTISVLGKIAFGVFMEGGTLVWNLVSDWKNWVPLYNFVSIPNTVFRAFGDLGIFAEVNFDRNWRDDVFQSLWKSFDQVQIVTSVKESFIRQTDSYRKAYEDLIDSKIGDLVKLKKLSKEQMSQLCNQLYLNECEMLSVKHNYMIGVNRMFVEYEESSDEESSSGDEKEPDSTTTTTSSSIVNNNDSNSNNNESEEGNQDQEVQVVQAVVRKIERKKKKRKEFERKFYRFSYDITKKLGSPSSYGTVVEGRYDGNSCAVKIVTCYRDQDWIRFAKEIHVLLSKSHKNLVKFISSTIRKDLNQGIIFMEKHQNDLLCLLKDQKKSLRWRLDVLIQIADVMQFLHSKHLFHRDLKLANILIAADGETIHICDFGFAISVGLSDYSLCGTIGYIDPVIHCKKIFKIPLTPEDYDLKFDVFSFGVIMAELYTQKRIGEIATNEVVREFFRSPPTPEKLKIEVLNDFTKVYPNEADIQSEYERLAKRCVNLVASKRPSFQEIHEELIRMKEIMMDPCSPLFPEEVEGEGENYFITVDDDEFIEEDY